MRKLALALLSVFFVLMAGCGYKEGGKIEEQASYLYFTGNAKGAEVTIDHSSSFIVEKGGTQEHYKVAPGKHTIVVKKDGNVVVNRSLLVGDGIAREINVP